MRQESFSHTFDSKLLGFGTAQTEFFYVLKFFWPGIGNSKYLHLRIQIADVAVIGKPQKGLGLFVIIIFPVFIYIKYLPWSSYQLCIADHNGCL